MQVNAFQFVHRENRNGTFDSVCTLCFQTVATVKEETSLKKFENEHVCDPHWVRRLDLRSPGV